MSAPAATTVGDGTQRSRRPTLSAAADYAAPIGLLAVCVIFFIATPLFLTIGNLTDLLVSAAILVILALGQQFAVTVAGIDLSLGANLPWAAALVGWGTSSGLSLGPSLLVAFLGALAVGVVNGILVAYLGVTDFIVTLGSLSVVSGITLLLTQGNNVPVNSAFLRELALGGIGPIRWFWLLALLLALGAWFAVFRTTFGTHLLATGGNREAARETGIDVRRIRLAAYAVSGALCGIAGAMLVARTGGADPSLQTSLLLSSIAAVVLGGSSLFGGKASILGTVTGAILLTALVNGFTLLGVSQYWQPVAVGAVVLAAALLSRFQK